MRARNKTPNDEPVYTAPAVAVASGMSLHTVHRAIARGELKATRTKPGTGHYRIRQSAYDAWIESLEVPTQTPAELPLDEAPASEASAVPPTTADAPATTAA